MIKILHGNTLPQFAVEGESASCLHLFSPLIVPDELATDEVAWSFKVSTN